MVHFVMESVLVILENLKPKSLISHITSNNIDSNLKWFISTCKSKTDW